MSTEAAPLQDVSAFFQESWALFKSRIWKLLAIAGVGSIAAGAASLLPVAAGGVAAGLAVMPLAVIWTVAGLSSVSILLWLMSAVQAALIECALAADADSGMWDCCLRGWRKTGPFSWVCILYILLVLGGFCLFALPGVFLSVALLFAPFAVLAEGVGGAAALRRSLSDTRGRFWPIAARVALVGIAASLLGFVPLIGWLLSALAGPFPLAALAVLYKELQRSRPAQPAPAPSWPLALGAAGLLLPVGLGFVVVPRVVENLPKILEAAKTAAQSQDPEQLQKLLGVIESGGSTTEIVSTAMSMNRSAPSSSTSTVVNVSSGAPSAQ